MEASIRGLLLLLVSLIGFRAAYADTNPQDAVALRSLMDLWENTPPSWGRSDDPCGAPWDGVICTESRITGIKLSTMGIKGTLSGDIGQLEELQSLDLSYNDQLGGTLTPNIESLRKLTTLILAGCSFTGPIPDELGNLPLLSYIALNSNKFSGKIPGSLGKLSSLYWLDLADNQLTGPLPISDKKAPGLDQLKHTKHFHFNKNQLSGQIPEELLSPDMSLIHLLLDGNKFSGPIPISLGSVQALEVIRLDKNSLDGEVPTNLNNLTKVTDLNLANNKLTGALPDLTGMASLSNVDLSNNTFDASEAPAWFSKLESLTTLIMESANLQGKVPEELFGLPGIAQVILRNNSFNGTLSFGNSFSDQLQLVDFQYNDLASVTVTGKYNKTLILVGNPVCQTLVQYCHLQSQLSAVYSTSTAKCGPLSCPSGQSINPQSCICAYPYEGLMVFRGPSFGDLTNSTVFQSLERSLWEKLDLTPGSVSLQNLMLNSDSYIQLHLRLFPSDGIYFNRSEILRIGFELSNQTYKPPKLFGPYYFIGSPYPFQEIGGGGSSSIGPGVVAGIVAGSVLLIACLVGVGIYAFQQKKRAQKAMELSRPFASWAPSGNDSGGAPQLKGARWFSFAELKKCTNNFSGTNEIGSGGYGKVYRGMVANGQMVAIKRSQQGSMQGGLEFKTEIELLSRVHHKNLVGLVGFCFDQGEQMLVYEFVPNGTLRESLSETAAPLSWATRMMIALGAAKGLAFLHNAERPVIYRDFKTSNILLDSDYTAKLSDFGLAKAGPEGDETHVSTRVMGTYGYAAPEYVMTGHLTARSDVYSFGVVLLELLTGRKSVDKTRPGKEISLVDWARPKLNDKRKLLQLIDPRLEEQYSVRAAQKACSLAYYCLSQNPKARPLMSDVVETLEPLQCCKNEPNEGSMLALPNPRIHHRRFPGNGMGCRSSPSSSCSPGPVPACRVR
ncbi:uncharacterized protein A4U43_C07F7720 [Asparagus officinalis]|uniref:Protein kinase domain-containing protein n=1 Tax=Asparagus officinalis TaxID=4686 RepID=A0A5P1EC19_ASPOF|nr:uncharacterized protein A4U43_C07F7720 [Asparagus officinalis]